MAMTGAERVAKHRQGQMARIKELQAENEKLRAELANGAKRANLPDRAEVLTGKPEMFEKILENIIDEPLGDLMAVKRKTSMVFEEFRLQMATGIYYFVRDLEVGELGEDCKDDE